MGIIRILPDDVISKIAAGEIVERPASVVKELIENSLDAGCSNIKITLESGGKKLISIEDDGSGMNRDDALLCLERHATSKINKAEDILNITTMGFRGEALPSISSVSKFRLITKQDQDLAGVDIIIDGGVISKVNETGCPVGTLIEVKHLFFNTPPRLKFLKRIDTELSNVMDVIQRHAITRYDVGFEVIHNNKTILNLIRREDLNSRLTEIYPKTTLHELFSESEEIFVHGFLCNPNDARTSTYKLFCYVNGRPVKDKLITRSILNSFGRVIEKGRFPQGVLFLNLPASDVDINVHPTKSEVRFHKPYKVTEVINNAINKLLEGAPWMSSYEKKSSLQSSPPVFTNQQEYGHTPARPEGRTYFRHEQDLGVLRKMGTDYSKANQEDLPQSETFTTEPGTADKDMFSQCGYFGSLNIVGQISNLYIVCESQNGMILIDQHAAHERVNYEKYKKQYENSSLQTQKFLFPEVIELSIAESTLMDENIELFTDMGFELEKFGDWSYLLRSAPVIIGQGDWCKIITDVLGEIKEHAKEKTVSEKIDHIIATVACHKSVTANQYLQAEKLKFLLNELDKADLPHFCPHGRPVAKEFTYSEMQKLFKRT